MKIILTEQELMNIVATHDEQDIKDYSQGKYNRWKIKKSYIRNDEVYELEYLYDDKGNLKEELKDAK